MLVVARQYSTVVDDVTEWRALKLQKFELSEMQWKIVDDLIHVLKVCGRIFIFSFDQSFIIRVDLQGCYSSLLSGCQHYLAGHSNDGCR